MRRDWKRIRSHVACLTPKIDGWMFVSAALIGLSGSGLIAWLQEGDTIYLIVCLGAAVGGGMCFVAAKSVTGASLTTTRSVLEEMDEVVPPDEPAPEPAPEPEKE